MMYSWLLITYFLLFHSTAFSNDFIQNGFYYKNPKFSVKSTNVTFGIAEQEFKFEQRNDTVQSFSEKLTAICQVELINRKKAQVSIDGIINLVFQEFNDIRSSGQEAVLNLLSNNLYYSDNDTRVNQFYETDLTGFFGASNFGTAKINSLPINYYGLPFVTAGDYARLNPDNQFSGNFPSENVTFAQVLNTFEFNSFNAILQILNYFNWTLVGSLFQANTYGYNRQQRVLEYGSKNSKPIFACEFIYGAADLFSEEKQVIDAFCFCINAKSSINVIVLWMSTTVAFSAITALRNQCSASKKWTFIITDDFQTLASFEPDNDIFKNSLLLRNNGPWDYEGFLQDCREYSSPETKEKILALLESMYSSVYKCKFNAGNVGDIPSCPDSIQDRKSECACTNKEIRSDAYTSKFLYIADGLSVYAEAISLIQNNCTLLNSKRGSIPFNDLPDFCSLTYFTPIQLSFAMRFVDFTGYTGPISFPNEVLIRKTKSYYLYSVYNTSLDATLVGYINQTGTTIYEDLISFKNNEVPISKIVPQNPNLSYAVVDVFFGVGIIELIICLAMLVFLIYNINKRVIRQAAPLVTIALLIGVTGLALSQVLLSFARTDAWCTINLYMFRIFTNVILMSLIVKNYRIYKIFANKKARAVSISESRLLSFIALTVLFYIIFLTTFVAVFGYKAILRQSSSNIYYQYVQCAIPNRTWNNIMIITLEIITIIQIFASLILAWLTRKVQTEYRESRRLAAFSVILFVQTIIFVPLSYLLKDETDSQILRYVIVVESLTVSIFSAFALLFVPIIFSVIRKKK